MPLVALDLTPSRVTIDHWVTDVHWEWMMSIESDRWSLRVTNGHWEWPMIIDDIYNSQVTDKKLLIRARLTNGHWRLGAGVTNSHWELEMVIENPKWSLRVTNGHWRYQQTIKGFKQPTTSQLYLIICFWQLLIIRRKR